MLEKPMLHITFQPTLKGMKVDISASPSVWAELAENGGEWSFDIDDTVIEIETKLDLPVGQRLRPISVVTHVGDDSVEDNVHALEWDDVYSRWMPASELNG